MRIQTYGKRGVAFLLAALLCFTLLPQIPSASAASGNDYWEVSTSLTVNGNVQTGNVAIPDGATVVFNHVIKLNTSTLPSGRSDLRDSSFTITIPTEIHTMLTAAGGSIAWQELDVGGGVGLQNLFGTAKGTPPVGVPSGDGKNVVYTLKFTPDVITAAGESFAITLATTTFTFKATESFTMKVGQTDDSSTTVGFSKSSTTASISKMIEGIYRGGAKVTNQNGSPSMQENDYVHYIFKVSNGTVAAGDLVDFFSTEMYTFVSNAESLSNGAVDATTATDTVWAQINPLASNEHYLTFQAGDSYKQIIALDTAASTNYQNSFVGYANSTPIDATSGEVKVHIWVKFTPSAAMKTVIADADKETVGRQSILHYLSRNYYKSPTYWSAVDGIPTRVFFDPHLTIVPTTSYSGVTANANDPTTDVDFSASTERYLNGTGTTVHGQQYSSVAVKKGDYVTFRVNIGYSGYSSAAGVDKVNIYLPEGLELVTGVTAAPFVFNASGGTAPLTNSAYVTPKTAGTVVKPSASGYDFSEANASGTGNNIAKALFERGYTAYEVNIGAGSTDIVTGATLPGDEVFYFTVYVDTDFNDIVADLDTAGITITPDTMSEAEAKSIYTYGMMTFAEIAANGVYNRAGNVNYFGKPIVNGARVKDDDAINDGDPFNDFFQYDKSTGSYLAQLKKYGNTKADPVYRSGDQYGERDNAVSQPIFSLNRDLWVDDDYDEDDFDIAMISSVYLKSTQSVKKSIGTIKDSWFGALKTELNNDTNTAALVPDLTSDGTVTKVGQIIPYFVGVNTNGAETFNKLTVTDTLSVGMEFVTDASGNPYVYVREVEQAQANRMPGYDKAGNPAYLINYNAASTITYTETKKFTDSVPTGWTFTLNAAKDQLVMNFGDSNVGNKTYEVYYLARVKNYSPTYTNNVVLEDLVKEEVSVGADYVSSGATALGHGKLATADLAKKEIEYTLELSFNMAFAAKDFVMQDIINNLGIDGNATVSTPAVTKNDAATTELSATAVADSNGNYKIVITNEEAISGSNFYKITFTVTYTTIPYGATVKNTFGQVTVETPTPLDLAIKKVDSASSSTILAGAQFGLYYDYTDKDNNTPVVYDYKGSTSPATDAVAVTTTAAATKMGEFWLDPAKAGTNANGESYWTLKLVEISQPGGYQMPSNPVTSLTVTLRNGSYVWDTTPTGVDVDNVNLVTVTVENEVEPTVDPSLNLAVTKVDSVSSSTILAGAEFSLYYSYTDATTNTPVVYDYRLDASNNATNSTPVAITTSTTGTDKVGAFYLNPAQGTTTGSTTTWVLKLVETQQPTNYQMPANPITEVTVSLTNGVYTWTAMTGMVVDNDNVANITIANEKEPSTVSLAVTKVDSENSATILEGAQFSLFYAYDANDVTQNVAVVRDYKGSASPATDAVTITTTTTGADSTGAFYLNPAQGTTTGSTTTWVLKLVETQQPSGYKMPTTPITEVTVSLTNGVYTWTPVSGVVTVDSTTGLPTVTVANEKEPSAVDLAVTKVDGKSPTTILAGAEFSLYYSYTDKTTNTPVVYNHNGSTPADSATVSVTTTTAGVDKVGAFFLDPAQKTGTNANNSIYWDLKLVETKQPSGYKMPTNPITEVTVTLLNGNYVWTTKDGVTVDSLNLVTVTVENEKEPSVPPVEPELKPAEVTLTAKKQLDGAAPTTEEFSFELVAQNGTVLETVKNSGGSVTFSTMSFEETGTFVYTIREVKGTEGYRYDENTYTATVEITKIHDRYQASVSYSSGSAPTFENETIPASELTELTVTKVWSVPEGTVNPTSVTVVLYQDGAEVDSVVLSDANNWTKTWEKLDKKSVWTVDEVDVPAGYTKTVTGSETSYTITNSISENPQPVDKTTSASFSASKVFNGGAPGNNPFRFTLTDNRGNVIETVRGDANGNISFSSITFREVGTYTYTITEVVGNTPIIIYDTASFRAVVTVSEVNDVLIAEVSYPDGMPIFNNSTIPSNPGGDEPEEFEELDDDGTPLGTWKPDDNGEWIFEELDDNEVPLGTLPNTGSSMQLVAALIGVACIALGVALSKKREEDAQ